MHHGSAMNELAYLKPQDIARLISQVMESLCGDDAYISLEGFCIPEGILDLHGANTNETLLLRRNTTSPVLQFVVLPLTRATTAKLTASIGRTSVLNDVEGLIHIQISKGNRLAFGAYDNVDEYCTVLYAPFVHPLSQALVDSGAISSFKLSEYDA